NTIFDNGCSQGNRETDSKALRDFGLTFRTISVYRDTAAVVTGSRGVPGRDTKCIAIENGERTSFWDKEWIESHILMHSFPRIYALACKKEGKVANFRL
ncbi:Uncharacterized protein TCM_029011, partial [Theobroma cacao]